MRYLSTRNSIHSVNLSEAIQRGLASDGGLYVPEQLPRFDPRDFHPEISPAETAVQVLAPFFEDDVLAPYLPNICKEALSFPVPLFADGNDTSILELFHGPTAAFKDIGAGFLAACFARMAGERLILVATSGDTGGAVAAAFHGKPGVRIGVLFPKDRVSKRQERQLTCWGGNVVSMRVAGTFDDCQRLVKAAFNEHEWAERVGLTSANSINIARLLPQITYYAKACLEYVRMTGEAPGLIVPTGNLGNGLAAIFAKRMGFPIREVVLATNSNRALADYATSGRFAARSAIKTLANAMDVGNPSNFERLAGLVPDIDSFRRECRVISVSDDEISQTIQKSFHERRYIPCPHTATALHAREQFDRPHWIVMATAHPAKFDDVVEPLIGQAVPVPPALEVLLDRESHAVDIEANVQQVIETMHNTDFFYRTGIRSTARAYTPTTIRRRNPSAGRNRRS